jgi:hypothetical protein
MRHRRLVADKAARAVAQHGLFFGEDECHGGDSGSDECVLFLRRHSGAREA